MSKIADIVNALRGAKSELSNLRARLKTLEKRREDLQSLPLPKSELVELVNRMIDEAGSAYPERLSRALNEYAREPLKERQAVNHDEGTYSSVRVCTATEWPQIAATPKTVERALCYLLGDLLKAGVYKAIDEMPYSGIVGPPMPERRKELAKIESEMASVKAQVKEAEEEMRAGGFG